MPPPVATNVPRTLPRRAASARPAWRGRAAERAMGVATGMLQRRPSSRASAVAGCSPRSSARSGSAGTDTSDDGIRTRERAPRPARRRRARGPAVRVPSSSARARAQRRRRRSPPSPTRTPASVPSTRHTGEQATPSARRSDHRAAAGRAAARRDTRRRAVRRCAGRRRIAAGRARRAPRTERTAPNRYVSASAL